MTTTFDKWIAWVKMGLTSGLITPANIKITMSDTITEIEEDVSVEDKTEDNKAIVLYNDDVNTFDNVIHCLVKYCQHHPEQAHQCALIIHTKGKYAVKHGEYDKLKPICEALLENQLSAKIE